MPLHRPTHGRTLNEFVVGQRLAHPWEVTLSEGMVAAFEASFLDAVPTYASRSFAQHLGFVDRPVHPLLLLNLGLSFSVHDVSERAIAHLAYVDVRFPAEARVGDTVTATSTVLGTKPSSTGDRGVVHVRTDVHRSDGTCVCAFERKALLPSGKAENESPIRVPAPPGEAAPIPLLDLPDRPHPLRHSAAPPPRLTQFPTFFEDLVPGDVYFHQVGRTIGESEHMQLTTLLRNTHPLHFDEVYCREGNSFRGTRVVYGGLVFAAIAALASRDLLGNALWDLAYENGAHPGPVVAGDTLYAASRIEECREVDAHRGEVTITHVGLTTRPERVECTVDALFARELHKDKTDRLGAKVFEITRRTLLLRR